jgi:hypothetical protein
MQHVEMAEAAMRNPIQGASAERLQCPGSYTTTTGIFYRKDFNARVVLP